MKKARVRDISCQCGQLLARYRKGGKGRLVKMFLSRIVEDPMGIFLVEPPLPLGQDIACPSCGKRIATIQLVKGQPAAKVNRGGVAPL